MHQIFGLDLGAKPDRKRPGTPENPNRSKQVVSRVVSFDSPRTHLLLNPAPVLDALNCLATNWGKPCSIFGFSAALDPFVTVRP